MTHLATRLDGLLAVLRATADLGPAAGSGAQLRAALAARLSQTDPSLVGSVLRLDDPHAEALAGLVAGAHALAGAFDCRPGDTGADTDTRPG